MFGYVTINRPELKVKELDYYEACYCGLCRQIRRQNGALGGLSLTYDMTFLMILLSSLYEEDTKMKAYRCPVHPTKHKCSVMSKAGSYAADMNFMLAYHQFEDNWRDEKKLSSGAMASCYRSRYKKLAIQYPRQHKALVQYVRKLHACETEKQEDVGKAAMLTGQAMAEIYAWKQDVWERPLREMGFFVGQFIYLMDAYDDIEKDKKTGNYNPLMHIQEEELEATVQSYLNLLLGGCCRAFEMLPIIEHVDLLRNILYSGVWMKFSEIAKKRRKETEGKKNDGSI